jgi:hypothetical protein
MNGMITHTKALLVEALQHQLHLDLGQLELRGLAPASPEEAHPAQHERGESSESGVVWRRVAADRTAPVHPRRTSCVIPSHLQPSL